MSYENASPKLDQCTLYRLKLKLHEKLSAETVRQTGESKCI